MLTDTERALFRDFACGSHSWLTLQIVLEGGKALSGQQGGSSYDRGYLEFDSKGICRRRPYEEPTEWVKVTALTKWSDALDPAVKERAVELCRLWGESQRSFPVFAASADACGCGPTPWFIGREGPMTYRQWLFAEEHDRYVTERLAPWEAQRREVDAAVRSFIAGLFVVGQCALFEVAA